MVEALPASLAQAPFHSIDFHAHRPRFFVLGAPSYDSEVPHQNMPPDILVNLVILPL
jgi:hypothetical protein